MRDTCVRQHLAALSLSVALALAAIAAPPPVRAAEPAVLTVTGAIAETNRPAFDPFDDALFKALQTPFVRAHAFTRADLLALPQQAVTARYPEWPRAVTARGPRLTDVLAAAGAEGPTIQVQAVDGYAPSFAIADLTDAHILALEADGTPLAVGGRGPVWLVIPPPETLPADMPLTDADLVWAVFHIAVQAGE